MRGLWIWVIIGVEEYSWFYFHFFYLLITGRQQATLASLKVSLVPSICTGWPYEGHPKSFRPRHIRQQYFRQSIHQWNVHSLLTLMSRLRIWRHCNLWQYFRQSIHHWNVTERQIELISSVKWKGLSRSSSWIANTIIIRFQNSHWE